MSNSTLNKCFIIPHGLWPDVDVIIHYVTNYPFSTPTHCKHCGSKYFRLSNAARKNKNNIPLYYCFRCKQRFSQITNTLFVGLSKLELWPEFANLRILGKSTTQITKEMPLSLKASTIRAKRLELMMAQLTPKLYEWWKPRQDYIKHELPIQVDVEYQKFTNWIKMIIDTTRAPCPHCGNQQVARVKTGPPDEHGVRHRHRPYFYCSRCKKYFNLLEQSPLKKLNKIEKWLPFIQVLVEGQSNYQIAERLDISKSSLVKWRKCFIKQMQLMHLTKLIRWIKWRRSRGVAYSSQQTKEHLKKNKQRE